MGISEVFTSLARRSFFEISEVFYELRDMSLVKKIELLMFYRIATVFRLLSKDGTLGVKELPF